MASTSTTVAGSDLQNHPEAPVSGRTLAEHEASAAELDTYEGLRLLFLDVGGAQVTPAEFKLLCNDLQARGLARFSDAIEDFGGLAVVNAIASEDSGQGPKVVVTDLGYSFLRFVTHRSDEQPSNER